MTLNFKSYLPYLIGTLIILVTSVIYFSPQLENKRLPQGDIISAVAANKYVNDYKKETGDVPYWNPSQFSGLPSSLLHLGKSSNYLAQLEKLIFFSGQPINLFFAVGFLLFLSLCLLGVNVWVSTALSIGLLMSTNYVSLYEAGHIWKVQTLTYCPLIICGTILCLRQDYLKGLIALIVGVSLAIFNNHIQMVYYVMLVVPFIGLFFIINAIQEKDVKPLTTGIVIALLGALIAGLSCYSQLNSAKKFADNTMRGEPILQKDSQSTQSNSSSKVKGLDWTYAMSWSNDTKDYLSILIPRMVGGSSNERIKRNDEFATLMVSNGSQVDKAGNVRVPLYWGALPFTSAPGYLGASILLLFLFVTIAFWQNPAIKGLAVAFVIISLLTFGKNASWFNKTLFDYLPLFNKFRSPSSAITVAPSIVFIAIGIGIQSLWKKKNKLKYLNSLLIAGGILGSLCLVIALFGSSLFQFLTDREAGYPANVQQIIVSSRQSLQSADSWRSFFIIALAVGLMYILMKRSKKVKKYWPLALAVLFVVDFIPVDLRYLRKDDFVQSINYDQQFVESASDKQIKQLEPNGRGFYRVLDLSTNTFNDAKPAYHHNQIGGYDPAKLQRYQDMIDYHISKNHRNVLDMLNTKYIISNQDQVQTNPNANGNAWFVDSVAFVNNAHDEISQLTGLNTQKVAVLNTSEFSSDIRAGDGSGSIKLTSYAPNELVYNSSSSSDQLAVFSEVWYGGDPDWKVFVDGNEVELLRVNYLLRAIQVPPGQHEIVMEFRPKARGAILSGISSALGLLIIIGAIIYPFLGKNSQDA